MLVSTLTNGKTYTCTVHATNAVGQQPRIPRIGVDHPRHGPTAPAQPTVTRGDGQISVAFVAPANGGSHDHRLHRGVHVERRWHLRDQRRRNLADRGTGLTNAKTYTCTVFADQRRRQQRSFRRIGVGDSRASSRAHRPSRP